MNAPISNIGALLSYSTSSSGTYTPLYSITSVPDLGGDPEQIDVTTIYDGMRKNIPGVKGNDNMEFNGLRGKWGAPNAQTSALVDEYGALAALSETTAYYWKLTYPDGSTHTWGAYPRVRQNGFGVNEALGYTLVLTVITDITYTAPSSGGGT